MLKRRGRDGKAEGAVQTKRPQGAGDRGGQAAGTRPSAVPKVARRGRGCNGAPPGPGSLPRPEPPHRPAAALIRGLANGSEDWPIPGTLLNRDLGEIYS